MNIKQIFLTLVKHIDTWKKLGITLTLVFGLGIGTLAYQFTYMYFTGNSEYYHSLAKRLRADDKITPIMETYRDKIGADRLIIAELHDGKKNTSGVRFAYMSGTYESDDIGITRILMDFQNVPTSLLAGLWDPLLKGECVHIDPNGGNLVVQSHFEGFGSNQTYLCPVIAPDGSTMIGVLLGTWRSKIKVLDPKVIEPEMKKAGLIISGLIYNARS